MAEQVEALKLGREILRQRKAKPLGPAKPPVKSAPVTVKTGLSAAQPVGTPRNSRPDPVKTFREAGSDFEAAKKALAML
jgi:hypothetical protein